MGLLSEGKTNWDIDLAYGKVAEKSLADILTSKKVEVKADRKVTDTGNIVIEYCFNGKPSGIAITEADYWAFFIGESKQCIFLIDIEHLKELARIYYKMGSIVKGGDFNAADMVKIPLHEIFKLQGVL